MLTRAIFDTGKGLNLIQETVMQSSWIDKVQPVQANISAKGNQHDFLGWKRHKTSNQDRRAY